jgi:alkylation response protein AidB-like acyl-CoA dehydrogenase
VDLAPTASQVAFRAELRKWLESNAEWDVRGGERAPRHSDLDQEFAFLQAWQRKLAADRWVGLTWPEEYGGRGLGPVEHAIAQEEFARAGAPELVGRIGVNLAGPTLLAHGTPEQKTRWLSHILDASIIVCQLFSEPGAGSDLASVRTKATRVKGGWALSGQKVWTSYAQFADWGVCLARSNPDVPKHKGITYFVVDMHAPGVTVRPLVQLTGEAEFNEVFLDDVFVPDELLVGEVNDGWRLARTTLVNERIAMGGGSSIGDAVEQLLAQAERSGATADDAVLVRLGGLISDGLAGSLLELRSALQQLDGNAGRDIGAVSSVRKLVGVRHRQDVAEAGLELLGAVGALDSEQLHNFLRTRCLSIAGGTTQVLLTLAGERILGLPRG